MRNLYILISLLLFANLSQSQNYIPFPQDSATWYVVLCYDASYGNLEYINYRFYLDGDTIINNKSYSKLYSTKNGYIGGLREENKNFYISPVSTRIGMYDYEFPTTEDNLLYTFDSLYVGKTFSINSYLLTVSAIDSVQFDGVYHKRYKILGSPVYEEYWIEGIGSDSELLANYFYTPEFESGHSTQCFEPNPNVVYHLFPYLNYCEYYVGINDIQPDKIKISPNPVGEILKINTEANHNNVTVTNTLGNVILNSTFSKDIVIDISSYTPGLYLITIVNDKGISKGKFVKK